MGMYRYYFEINQNGDPIEGSNIRTTRPPRSASKRWKQIYTAAQACCDTDLGFDPTLEKSIGRRNRYYVRLDENKLPVSGSLMKHTNQPPTFQWQEVVGMYCCPMSVPDSTVTFAVEDGDEIEFIVEGDVTNTHSNCIKIKSIDGVAWEYGADYEVGDITITTQAAYDPDAPYAVTIAFDDSADVSESFDVVFTDCSGRNAETITFTVTFEAP